MVLCCRGSVVGECCRGGVVEECCRGVLCFHSDEEDELVYQLWVEVFGTQ